MECKRKCSEGQRQKAKDRLDRSDECIRLINIDCIAVVDTRAKRSTETDVKNSKGVVNQLGGDTCHLYVLQMPFQATHDPGRRRESLPGKLNPRLLVPAKPPVLPRSTTV